MNDLSICVSVVFCLVQYRNFQIITWRYFFHALWKRPVVYTAVQLIYGLLQVMATKGILVEAYSQLRLTGIYGNI